MGVLSNLPGTIADKPAQEDLAKAEADWEREQAELRAQYDPKEGDPCKYGCCILRNGDWVPIDGGAA